VADTGATAGQAHPGAQRAIAGTGGRFPVKHGSVMRIHTRSCPRADDGNFTPHQCKGSWRYTLEYGRDSNGARLQTSKAGYPTRGAAQSALQEVVRTFMVDVGVHSLTVGEYLETWLAGKHALKPKTMALYRDFTTNYLVPNLGEVRRLELRAHHLDRMYSAIALGRRGRPLSPSTIRRVHAVLRSALNSAVKRRLLPYSAAEQIELAPEATQAMDGARVPYLSSCHRRRPAGQPLPPDPVHGHAPRRSDWFALGGR
jgi:hypothetical protein